MASSCCENKSTALEQLREKQGTVLKIVLAINLVMFLVEFSFGIISGSSSLKADSLDMLGDSIVYAFSLYVLQRNEKWRASAAFLKGLIIVGFAIVVLVDTTVNVFSDTIPIYETMGMIALLALIANSLCLYLLYRHRDDDINMKSTYICSRNDIISNCGVILAAVAVNLTQSKWPDIIVGYLIALIFFKSSWPILIESIRGMRLKSELK